MNSMKLVIPLQIYSRKKAPNGAVTPQRQSQFTPKMKANAVPRLLSSLVLIDQYNECNRMTSFVEFTLMDSYQAPSLGIYCFFEKGGALMFLGPHSDEWSREEGGHFFATRAEM